MRYVLAVAILVATSGVSDAKCRLFKNLLGKRAARQACVVSSPACVVSSPACGVFVSDATPVEVVVEEKPVVELSAPIVTTPMPQVIVAEPLVTPKAAVAIPEPPAPAASIENIIGKNTKQAAKDNSPAINFKLK